MKKLNILLIALVAIVLCGCEAKDGEDYLSYAGCITKFEYEGHTYLLRDAYNRGGICHDENCKCKTDSIK